MNQVERPKLLSIEAQQINVVGRGASWRQKALGLAIFIALLCSWELAVNFYEVPTYMLPPPTKIFASFMNMVRSGLLWSNAAVTLSEAFLGFGVALILAFIIGTLIAEFKTFGRFVYPYFAALQAMPKVAIAPLVVIWFGFGLGSKIALAALLAFFPMLVSIVNGLRAVDQQRLMLLRSLDASRLTTLRVFKFPNALPNILTGVELGAIYSMLGAIVAEFVGSTKGIGNWLLQMNFNLDSGGAFALLLVLALYGVSIQFLLSHIRKRLLFWTDSGSSNKH